MEYASVLWVFAIMDRTVLPEKRLIVAVFIVSVIIDST